MKKNTHRSPRAAYARRRFVAGQSSAVLFRAPGKWKWKNAPIRIVIVFPVSSKFRFCGDRRLPTVYTAHRKRTETANNVRVRSTRLTTKPDTRVWYRRCCRYGEFCFVARRPSNHGRVCDSGERRTRFAQGHFKHGPFRRRLTTINRLCVHIGGTTGTWDLRMEERLYVIWSGVSRLFLDGSATPLVPITDALQTR